MAVVSFSPEPSLLSPAHPPAGARGRDRQRHRGLAAAAGGLGFLRHPFWPWTLSPPGFQSCSFKFWDEPLSLFVYKLQASTCSHMDWRVCPQVEWAERVSVPWEHGAGAGSPTPNPFPSLWPWHLHSPCLRPEPTPTPPRSGCPQPWNKVLISVFFFFFFASNWDVFPGQANSNSI